MASQRSLALLYGANIGHARTPMELRKAVNLFLSNTGGFSQKGTSTRKHFMERLGISQETIAPFLSKTIGTKFGEMQPTYPGRYGELAGVMGELRGAYPGKAEDVLGMGFEHLRYANIGEDFPAYKLGSTPELERHAGQYRGENYYEYAQRLAQAGYRPPQGAASPTALAWQIQHTRNIMGGLGQEQVQLPTPSLTPIPITSVPQPTPTAPIPQPTPTPQISFSPTTPQAQPTYQPAPTTAYQSTYYQANGYKPYGGYQQDTFGDKPFSYAYKQPRLMQSYTGI